MNKITIALIASLLCQSCLWIDKIIPPKEYDWKIDTHHTIVTSDHGATINAIGDNIPNGINWSSEPNDIVRLTPANNGKCCHIDYIRDGEGIITATYDTKSENCEFKSQIYSSTGLHLKINGTDRYFPLIEHNGEGDGISKITRKFVCSVPKDTLKVEFVEFVPKETEEKIIVENIFVVDQGFHFDETTFSNVRDHFRISGSSVSYNDDNPNFPKIKGLSIIQRSMALHDNVSFITLELNTNVFENSYGKSCCFRINFIESL